MNYFDHPYPRYGLAAVLEHHDIKIDGLDPLPDKAELAKLAADYINVALHKFRIHTKDKPKKDADTKLRFRYLSKDELEESGQKAEDFYYLAPQIASSDSGARYLIKYSKNLEELLRDEENLGKSFELKRSFSPFTAKINEGVKSLSYPKGTTFEAAFILIATLTPNKPAAQVDFNNQVMIPDLPIKDLIQFVRLFEKMKGKETKNVFIRNLKAGNENYRPPIYNGNYPNAPQSPIFGPVGLVGAMGKWARRAGHRKETEEVLEKLVSRPLYMVSYEPSLFKQVHLGHHVVRLAKNYDLPNIISGLYHADFYNSEHNKRGNKSRQLFYEMASRFLQFYTAVSFQDFLAFRLEYPHSFSQILEDYFMSEKTISKEIVQSAQNYGAYLNKVAYIIGKEEVKNKDTGRDLREAKAKVLAQLESAALSCKNAPALFAQLNVQAGRMSNMDVPSEAAAFIEATNAGEITLHQARDLILAYMRLRGDGSNKKKKEATTSKDATFTTDK